MSTTSQKHRNFVGEPMGDKPVTALSGIGEVLGRSLEHKGFDKVSSHLLDQDQSVLVLVQTQAGQQEGPGRG